MGRLGQAPGHEGGHGPQDHGFVAGCQVSSTGRLAAAWDLPDLTMQPAQVSPGQAPVARTDSE